MIRQLANLGSLSKISENFVGYRGLAFGYSGGVTGWGLGGGGWFENTYNASS